MSELKLPSYFPRAPKECTKPAEAFFECFTKNSVKKDENDMEAGKIGLAACTSQLAYYDQCMQKGNILKKVESKTFRVQEEYRKGGSST